jgi:hypothetical protein
MRSIIRHDSYCVRQMLEMFEVQKVSTIRTDRGAESDMLLLCPFIIGKVIDHGAVLRICPIYQIVVYMISSPHSCLL